MYPYITFLEYKVQAWILLIAAGYIIALLGMLTTNPKDLAISRLKITITALAYMYASWYGAATLHVIINIGKYAASYPQHALDKIGIASLGAPLAGIFVVWILSKVIRFSFIEFADFAFPFIMIVRAFARIGCIFAGCCYGIPTSLAWGFPFLGDGLLRHPTQAYMMAVAFAVFGSARFLYKGLRSYKGFVFFYVIFAYSLLRFFVDFLRAEGPFIFGYMKWSQPFLAIIMLIALVKLLGIARAASIEERREIKKYSLGALLRALLWFGCSVAFPLTIAYIVSRIWL